MNDAAALLSRWQLLALVVLVEAMLSWLAGAATSSRLAAPLAMHPDGVAALGTEGGRLAIDLYHRATTQAEPPGRTAALVVLAYAFASLALAGVLARALAAPNTDGLVHTLRVVLRRCPSLMALGLLALACYAGLAYIGWRLSRWGADVGSALTDVRAADLLWALGWILALSSAAVVRAWHDLARAHALGANASTFAAARHALVRLVRTPRETLPVYATCTLATIAMATLGLAAGGALPLGAPLPATLALVVVQQALLAACTIVRAYWLARATRPYRDSAAESPRPT